MVRTREEGQCVGWRRKLEEILNWNIINCTENQTTSAPLSLQFKVGKRLNYQVMEMPLASGTRLHQHKRAPRSSEPIKSMLRDKERKPAKVILDLSWNSSPEQKTGTPTNCVALENCLWFSRK